MARHMCEFQTDDWVLDELFTERTALVGVFDGFFVADTGEAEALDDNTNTFMIEVCHDNWKMSDAV